MGMSEGVDPACTPNWRNSVLKLPMPTPTRVGEEHMPGRPLDRRSMSSSFRRGTGPWVENGDLAHEDAKALGDGAGF